MEPKADKVLGGISKAEWDTFNLRERVEYRKALCVENLALQVLEDEKLLTPIEKPQPEAAPLDTFSLSAAIVDAIQKHPEEAKYPRDLRNVIEEAIKTFVGITVERR